MTLIACRILARLPPEAGPAAGREPRALTTTIQRSLVF